MSDPRTTPDTDIDGAAESWRFVGDATIDLDPGPLVWTEPTPPAVRVAVTHDGLIHVQINGTPVDEAARLWLDAVLGEVRHRNAGLPDPTRTDAQVGANEKVRALSTALAFYADAKTYQSDGHYDYERRPIFDDCGALARAALGQIGGGNG